MIYFRGCTAREKLKSISIATEEILKNAEIDYNILENEKCCGSFLLRTGFVDDAKKVMKETFKKIGNDKIIVSCAGCYKTFRKDYKEILGVELEVIHTSEIFKELLDEDKIKIEFLDKKVTYHDPCHLGREMEQFDIPREVISKIVELTEMERNRENSRCCGSGAGVKSAYPEITEEIAKMRIEDAGDAKIIITACPFCILNISSINSIEVLDISEILLKALKKK
ncbi:(Fe-S)-binding protein [Methanobacterium sp. ACI-7]|uniref:(Fe-S)-binding protein n=1 Tax=unclassified Methanobacterium TaxID=2627676 RepID=UPI0039C1BDEE